MSEEDRRRITSVWRMATALMVLVVLIVAPLTALIFASVSHIFAAVTPAMTQDLEWKALRGSVELSNTAQFGLVVQEAPVVERAARDYLTSTADEIEIVARAADGTIVFAHGANPPALLRVFSLAPGRVHRMDERLIAWSPALLEGNEVGSVAVAVSTARLRAGDELRQDILSITLVGGFAALLLSLAFVFFYILPLLRLTQTTFVRLERTTELALEGARLKAQFLANMSHEIRTPMNSVVGLAKLMLDMPLGPKIRRYAEMIDASARSLLSLINDILDFSKVEAGKYELTRGPCEVAALVQEAVEVLAEKANGKGIDLIYRIDPLVPHTIEADADRVRQVMTNLLGNAVKFTEKGEVYLQVLIAERQGNEVVLHVEVQDTGIGVPEDLRDHIFESFSQADGSTVRRYGGTGLGLAISKQFVNLMGGEIGLQSEVGKGSSFWFTLPAKVLDAGPAVRAQPNSIGKMALIACENEHAAGALEEHVVAWGMSAIVATSPEEANQHLRGAEPGAHFDIVLACESSVSSRSISEVLAAIRAELDKPPPIVVLTQVHSAAKDSLGSEISAHLVQPVRMSELYECMTRVLTGGQFPANASTARAAVRTFSGAKVLVVDDNDMNQFVAAEQLARFGCIVEQATNGREAVDAVLSNDYALVLMDCQMPVMDGYAATREIRSREGGRRRTTIIALTAHALAGERDLVLAAGMDDYLTKPVRPQRLQRALERWIEGGSPPVASAAVAEEIAEPREGARDESLAPCSTALLRLFAEKVPIQIELLDGALAMAELKDVTDLAHKLKGSLFTVSADQLAELAQQIQDTAQAGDLSSSEAIYQNLLHGYYELEASIKRELGRRVRAAGGAAHG